MKYLYLTEGDDGVSFFENRSFELTATNFAPPAPDVLLSEGLAASGCVMLKLPVGWGGPQHRSPHNQIAFCLAGRGLIEAGNGDTREFYRGDIWWMADTTGSGHTTTVLGDEPVLLSIVKLSF